MTDDTREVLEWLRHPPLPWMAGLVYRLFFQQRISRCRRRIRKKIGLRVMPRGIVVPVTRWFLRMLRFAVGPENPIQDAAIARMARE